MNSNEQQIGYGISDFFKKHKIFSKALNFIEKSGLQDKVLDNLPVPGLVKNIGKAGIKKFSNFLQEKGYGINIEDQIDYYIQPSIQPKIGLGLKELEKSVKKLDEIYHELYLEIQAMKDRQQKKKEAPIKKTQPLFLDEKSDIQTDKEKNLKKYEKSDSETEEQRKHRQFLLREAEQQRIIELNKQRQKDLPIHPLVQQKIKKRKQKTKQEIIDELIKQFQNESLIKDNSDIIDDYLKNEIDYTQMQKEFSQIKKTMEVQQKPVKKKNTKERSNLLAKIRYYKNIDNPSEKQQTKLAVLQDQLKELNEMK